MFISNKIWFSIWKGGRWFDILRIREFTIKGSTLIKVELVSARWEEGMGSLEEGETKGIWVTSKKSLRISDKLDKDKKDHCKDI